VHDLYHVIHHIMNYGRYVKDMRRPWLVNESNSHKKNNVNDTVFYGSQPNSKSV